MLTTDERDAVLEDGAKLAGDALWAADERDRWRRFPEVAYSYRQCSRCGYWIDRDASYCGHCGEAP
jgi:hypothetical protein